MLNLIPQFIVNEYQAERLSGEFEAASLMMDISGFTRLTEILMKHGKHGAERLTHALNHVLSTTVQLVHEHGGFITHFVGDGFIALFPGEAGAACAAQTAEHIQTFVQENGLIATPDGSCRLKVHIGLGWGHTTWNIIGQGNSLTYSFRGDAIKTCVLAEGEAEANETKCIPELAERFLTSNLIQPSPTPPVSITISPDIQKQFGLAAIHAEIVAEFRSVATVFISLGEPATEHLQTFVNQVLNLVTTYGGYFNKLEYADKGDVILAVFGAPISQGNNLKRAADFLLALKTLSTPVEWRAGFTEGTVYAGLVGSDARNEYTVIGAVVNLASRLMSKAKPGEILTHHQVNVRLKESYLLDFTGTEAMKGIEEVPVYRLTGKRSDNAIQPEFSQAIVERAAELDALINTAAPLFDGHFGGLVFIHGDAGMGKSRLVYEFSRRVTEQKSTLWLNSNTSDTVNQSLLPFRTLLKDYFGQVENRPDATVYHTKLDELASFLQAQGQPELYERLEAARPFVGAFIDLHSEAYEQAEPNARFDNMVAAFKTLIQAECQRQPVILAVEDAHWLDDDSRTLIEVLIRDVADYPFIVVFTSRYIQDADGNQFNIEADADVPRFNLNIAPLSKDGVAQIARNVIGEDVSTGTLALLQEITEGNPLFVEALLHYWQERNALVKSPDWRLKTDEIEAVPTSLLDLFISQLDQLDGSVKVIVQQAAVLGKDFRPDVLAKMRQNDPELIAKIHRAETYNIWHKDAENRYTFYHALLRQAAYEMQMPEGLRLAHYKAAQAIEELYASDLAPHYYELAYQYRYAEAQDQEQHYASLAGQRAAQEYLNQSAQNYLSRALELTPQTAFSERFALHLLREQVYDRLGNRDEQAVDLAALDEIAAALNDFHANIQAALRHAAYSVVINEFDIGIQDARRAIELAAANNDQEAIANSYLALAKNLFGKAEYSEAQHYFQEALNVAEAANFRHLLPECLRGLGDTAIVLSPSFDDALAYFEQALEICDEIQDIAQKNHTVLALGIAAFRKGEHTKAKQWFEIAREGFDKMNDRRNQARSLTNLGIMMSLLNNRAEAVRYFYDALAIVREVKDRLTEARLFLNIGIIELYMGNYESSVKNNERAVEILQTIGNKHVEAQVQINTGLVRRYQGFYSAAEAHYQRAKDIYLELIREEHEDTYFGFAMVAFDLGEYENAHSNFAAALDRYRESGDKNGEADVSACLAMLYSMEGHFEEAISYGEAALNLTIELEEITLQAFASMALGDIYFRQGGYDRAAEYYQSAVNLREELNEQHLVAEARTGLAHIALKRGNVEQMRELVNQVVQYWEQKGTFDGAVEPVRIFLVCYQILAILKDRRANALLEAGWETLQRRANSIGDEARRDSYLMRVPVHREFTDVYQQASR